MDIVRYRCETAPLAELRQAVKHALFYGDDSDLYLYLYVTFVPARLRCANSASADATVLAGYIGTIRARLADPRGKREADEVLAVLDAARKLSRRLEQYQEPVRVSFVGAGDVSWADGKPVG